MKKELERTEEMLHKSLKELNDKGDYNNNTLDMVCNVIDTIKDISEIREHENPSYGRGGWMAEGSYGRRDGDGDGRYYEGRRYDYDRFYGRNY